MIQPRAFCAGTSSSRPSGRVVAPVAMISLKMNAPTAVMGILASLLAAAVFGVVPSLQTRRLALGERLAHVERPLEVHDRVGLPP